MGPIEKGLLLENFSLNSRTDILWKWLLDDWK